MHKGAFELLMLSLLFVVFGYGLIQFEDGFVERDAFFEFDGDNKRVVNKFIFN